jgi:hypothetical protein
MSGASSNTVEIADLVLYHGKRPTFLGATSVVIVQLKYSIASLRRPFRASDAKNTIQKFALAYREYKKAHGDAEVERKLAFEIVTNRPLFVAFTSAVSGLAKGSKLSGEAKKQAAQFSAAAGLQGQELSDFARKLRLTGLAGDLTQHKQLLSRALVDWSAAPDALARARLGNLRQLLRDKAGLAGEGKNVVSRADVLDALELQGPEDLFPCPTSFPEVGRVVEREQLPAVAGMIPRLTKPLLVHAAGGVGKTVFLQSVAELLSEDHQVILFDCFGGGAYRAPEDARHLPNRGLIHIINLLACEGLCDPLLPVHNSLENIIKACRARLAQAVNTLRRRSTEKQLLIFIDAIDNAAEHAKDRGEPCFPKMLLESFFASGPIAGVQLIVSCRTYRRAISRGDVPCEEIELQPFTPNEADRYLRDRIPRVTKAQIHVAYSRSGGNARILEHLALSDRGLLDPSEVDRLLHLDDLLKERIGKALAEATKRGYKQSTIKAFLGGLAVLPPPVPLAEYADAHGIEISAVSSFAADLAPLLEQNKHGMTFRDEPTETLVRETYASDEANLRVLAENLLKKQDQSVYAASALPSLLQKLKDGDLLFALAFDDRIPTVITSTVGKQRIRYSRLKAAVLHSSNAAHFDRLVRLLVELSTLAAGTERGSDYVLAYPDLVIAAQDVDATRRLFELRTAWPGTRHARLAIASVISGDISDASRHAINADEWIFHFYKQDEEYQRDREGPESIDIAALPLCLIAQNREKDAARLLTAWREWYAYELGERLFALLKQAESTGGITSVNTARFVDALGRQPGVIAAALSFLEPSAALQRRLIRKLVNAVESRETVEGGHTWRRDNRYVIDDGLLKAAALGVSLGMRSEARAILNLVPDNRPGLWSLMERHAIDDASAFVTSTALRCAVNRNMVTERDLLPQELVEAGGHVKEGTHGNEYRKLLTEEVVAYVKSQQDAQVPGIHWSYDKQRDAQRFIDDRLGPLCELTRALSVFLAAQAGRADKPFVALVEVWQRLRQNHDRHSAAGEPTFIDRLGQECLTFALWSRDDLEADSIQSFVDPICENGTTSINALIDVASTLAKRPTCHDLAGRLGNAAKLQIDLEDDVSQRTALFAKLARALVPASLEEAGAYFRAGLDQMDAIGSGDYQFTNELLRFAGELKGDEIAERDSHTLLNICELNMSSDEKFPWSTFARGLARVSGRKSLARLGRWADREKVSLDFSLLPYLTALIEQDKIDPSIMLGLLRLSAPVELYDAGTEQLAEAVASKQYARAHSLLREIVLQFQQNHPTVYLATTIPKLLRIAERELGGDSEEIEYLSRAAPLFEALRAEANEQAYNRSQYSKAAIDTAREEEINQRCDIERLEAETNPLSEESITRALEQLAAMHGVYDLRKEFFARLRAKVPYAGRGTYIRIIARVAELDLFAKLLELTACKDQWGASTASLDNIYSSIAAPMVRLHADDFVQHGHVAGYQLKTVSDLAGSKLSDLALELIRSFAASDDELSASIWMGLAVIICPEAAPGQGEVALTRLLNSSAAYLASTVMEGASSDGLYPTGDEVDIAAGLVWLSLGSPIAARRWRAAHSVRCFARLGRMEVVDALMKKYHATNAHPFQAPELPFYFLHARLWLLIAIARAAKDHPAHIATYADQLKSIALATDAPHVLLRHFATQALLECAKHASVVLSEQETALLAALYESPYEPVISKDFAGESFYRSRPDSIPESDPPFHFEYDFDKTDVSILADVFGRSRWETRDTMTAWVRQYDQQVTSMYDTGGRVSRGRDRLGLSDRAHLYGQHLGWHALFLTAGDFLKKYAVVHRPFSEGDPWDEWLRRSQLTRKDGLWLADGSDRPPIDAHVNLLVPVDGKPAITGQEATLLSLLKIGTSIEDELVVAADWRSVDGVGIHVTSALTTPRHAERYAHDLSQTDAFQAWLPHAEQYEGDAEYERSKGKPLKAWIVWPSYEPRLDATDPLGVSLAARRLSFVKEVIDSGTLASIDPFRRIWVKASGVTAVRSEAWGRNRLHDEDEPANGQRLLCSSDFLKEVLTKRGAELLVLLILRRYQQGVGGQPSQFWHTTGVVRINQVLECKFYPGEINKLHVSKY